MAEIRTFVRLERCDEGEEDEEAAGSARGYNTRRSTSKHRTKTREVQNEHAKFVDGVKGPKFIGPPHREEIQQQCKLILKYNGIGFAGSHAVTMDVQNIHLLNEKPYRVSWKADGTRYMMYIRKEDEVYMIDRDSAVFLIPRIKFFDRHNLEIHLKDTLVDGEMVFDETPKGVRPRYLIYDIMQFNGSRDIAERDHKKRSLCINKELIQPRDAAAQKGLVDKATEPFGIKAKKFFDLKDTRMVLQSFNTKLTHKTNGLIFFPVTEPYQPGRCYKQLKWNDQNSLDFRLKIVESDQPGLDQVKEGWLYVGGREEPFAKLNLKRNKEAESHNGCIIECYLDKTSSWNFMRVRKDKSFPNSLKTAKGVLQSIEQPVTEERLLEEVENHRWKPSPVVGEKRHERAHSEEDEDHDLMPPPKRSPTKTKITS